MAIAVRVERPAHHRRWFDSRMRQEDIELRMRLDRAIRDNAAAIRFAREQQRHPRDTWDLNYWEEQERRGRWCLNELCHVRDGRGLPERES